MNFITLDFETYYSQEYSLTKMSTEDYVCDPRFEVILVGIKINNDQAYWITGTKADIKAHLLSLKIQECALLCHHTMFDGLILAVQFGIYAAMYTDTRLLAQAQLKPYMRSVSLDSCLKHIDLGIKKGEAVHKFKGYNRANFSKQQLQEYADYCMTDVEGTFRLFKYLAPQFPRSELEMIDIILRMYLQPTLTLKETMLQHQLWDVRSKQQMALASLPPNVTKSDLMSNPKFAAVLQSMGVDPPMKISPTTGKQTYAFAKSDTGWKELEDEYADDPVISALLMSRLSAKSTLEETRTVRLIRIAQQYGLFRIPLLYYAAHTGRLGGSESINAQNFPRVDKSKMRYAVLAPKDHVVLAADLAQIEARITAWICGQVDLVTAFRNKLDVYAEFATRAFRVDTKKGRSKEDDKRRFVGKTCILGLGFGMGPPKLRNTLRKDGLRFDDLETQGFVTVYRGKYPRIPATWRHLDDMLEHMAAGTKIKFGPVTLCKDAVILPNGMAIVYANLRYVETEGYTGWVYDYAGEVRTIWGGKMLENIVQALARILVMDYMLEIKRKLKIIPALQQHDELDYVVHKSYAERVKKALSILMTVPPTWAPDLPVAVEIEYGESLGDCK